MADLQIPRASERTLVRLADFVLAPLGWRPRARRARPVERVLLLRLERIGDLLMVLDAIRAARHAWPAADIDLVVGSWNEGIARLLPELTRVETLDVPWLARDGRGDDWPAMIGRARTWRRRRYDVVLNFEPDIRSNLLAWLSGAPMRLGYSSGGGGALLTSATSYAAGDHVSVNADRLVSRAVQMAGGREPRASATPGPRLAVPDRARQAARALLAHARPPLIGVHVSGGRESKQWHLSRFAEAAEALAHVSGGTLVLTGGPSDRAMVDEVARALGDLPVIDAAETGDLVLLAAVLAELDVLVTGDTGPMHLAAAVGTPVVALFGPSNPARYGPRAAHERILRVELPCSPCGLVRLPPPRCRGRVPECMDGITVESVVAATLELLDSSRPARAARA